MIGVWAVVTGLLQIVAAVRLRNVITTEWLMAFAGILSTLPDLLQPGIRLPATYR